MRNTAVFLLLAALGLAAYFLWWKREFPPRRLTSDGTVCLLRYASATTSQGIVGFPPGTLLKIVSERGNTLVLGDGQVTVEVARAETTDDLDVAARAARADASNQDELTRRRVVETEAAAKAEKAALARMEADRQRRAAEQASAPVGSGTSALNQPAERTRGGVGGYGGYYYSPNTGSTPSLYRDAYGRQYSYDNFGNRVYR